jgi:type I restriction enzyme, S subunit
MEKYPTYKDSGIKWIGEIPVHWKCDLLKRFIHNVKTGSTPQGAGDEYFDHKGLPWFTPSDFKNDIVMFDADKHLSNKGKLSVKIFPSETILMIGIGGTMGKVSLSAVECSFNQQINAISTSESINKKFLIYYLRAKRNDIFNTAKYTTLPILNQQETKRIQVIYPPFPEQQSIVTFLEKETANIDAYIKQCEQEINALNELKQAEIAQVVTKGLNPNAPMKDSGIAWIGEIPEHWECLKIRYLFKEKSQKGFPNEPILSATQKYGVIPQDLYENRVVVVNKGLEGLKLVEVGDFVISLRSFQGGIEYAYYRGIISAAYTILRPSNTVNSNFIKFLFKSLPFIELLKTCVTGIREGQNINYDILRNNYLMLPPIEEQQQIVDYIESKTSKIEEYITTLKSEIVQMQEYKQRLISDVVTGKMKV